MSDALLQEKEEKAAAPSPEERFKYWAFISYSHADEEWAQWLHKSLETYRVPKKLVGRQTTTGTLPRRLFPVFRDRDELPGASDLGGNIKEALRQSRYIVVICSPKSAISKWVNEEIKGFKSLGREDRVLCLIVDGEPNARPDSGQLECFPPAVRFRVNGNGELTDEPTEPIAADARKGKDGRANAKLKLLSGILNVGFDELKQREKQRQLYQKLRLAAGALALVLASFLIYIMAADANINVPGGEGVRTLLDRHNASLLRPVHTDAEVRRAAAGERRILLDTLKRARSQEGWLYNNLNTRDKLDAWSHAQMLFVAFQTPDATNEELREFLPSLELLFTSGAGIEVNGIKYGWTGEVITSDGGKSSFGTSEDVEAAPSLWTAAAITAALARPGLIKPDERPRFESYLKYAQEALRLYRPMETGGWNLYVYQKDPGFHDPYSTVLALMLLLETKKANFSWEGSVERRDQMLQATAQWLANAYSENSNPPGWKGTSDEVNAIFDGLTLQIYALLLRAEAEAGFRIPQKILDQIPRHLAQTNSRDINYPTARSENQAAVADPNTGREYRRNESIGFLWHPWAIDSAVRWLKRTEKYGAPPEQIVRVRRALGHMVVDMRDEAIHKATSEWAWISSETLLGLSAVPAP